jgi:spermidine synthase
MGTCNILFFLSGAAALGYEVVATRLFGLGLGCETASTLAVVGAFMAGTGIGAWMGDRPVRRTPEPAHLYGLYQLTFGIWAIASLIAIPWLCDRARVWVGANPDPLRQWGIVFLTVTAALLPATAATGASLQAMEQLCSRLSRDGRTIPGLYAANTAGAVAGILGAALLSAPLGFRRTLLACGALSLICAIGAARLIFKVSGLPARTYQMADPPSGRRLAITLFATGFLGIAYEVLVIRSLSLVLSNTFYTFAITLAVYLLGTSAGAAVYARTGPKRTKPGAHSDVTEKSSRGFLTGLVAGLAACCAGALHLLPQAGRFQTALAAAFGGGQGAEAASEFATAALVLFLPAAFMGATFSHLAQMAAPGRGVGWALAVNTLGGALAPPLVAVGLVPWIGVKSALAGQTLCYLALLPNAALRRAWPALVAIALIITAPVQWGLMSAPPGGRVLAQRDGALATTLVVADHAGHRYLKLHSRLIDGGTQSTFGERRMAHIPLLFHPDPRRALCLGVGSGNGDWRRTPSRSAGCAPVFLPGEWTGRRCPMALARPERARWSPAFHDSPAEPGDERCAPLRAHDGRTLRCDHRRPLSSRK